jgi:hypothetical protein
MPIGTPAGSGAASTAINDGVATAQKATVAQFHNSDNQTPGAAAYGLFTGGVAQLLNLLGNLDRQRETGIDGIPALGVSTGSAQFAMAFLATDATDNFAAGARTFTPAAMAGVLNGVAWSIQAGSVVVLDSGANAEAVLVTGVTATTFSCTTTKTHNGTVTPFPITGFVYNQERDASGELDGATGAGTAVAAEYEWNGNPAANGSVLANTQFDRARNLNGKGFGAGTLANNPLAANSVSLLLNAAPAALQPGQKILIDRASGSPETNYVGLNYTFGSSTVPLRIPTQFSHAQNATVEWDTHAPLGPGLNGFLPDGIGIEEEALWDPVTQKFYIERAATQDAAPGANIVLENVALYNGATFDRQRTPNIFKPQNGVAIAATPGTAIWTTAVGKKFRLMRVVLTSSVAGNLVLTDASGGTVIAVIPVTAAGAGVPFDFGNGYLSSTINNALFAFNSGGAATISGTLVGTEE